MNDTTKQNLIIANAKAIGFKEYTKPATQLMIEWTPDFNTEGVSISQSDKDNGSPKEGDMIAVNVNNTEDMWLVAKDFFEANYIPATNEAITPKSLGNTTIEKFDNGDKVIGRTIK